MRETPALPAFFIAKLSCMQTEYLFLLFFALPFSPSAASAATDKATDCVFSAEAGLRMESFEYRETDLYGQLIDREDGLLPALHLGASTKCGAWDLTASGSLQRARLDYDGRTSGGRKLSSRTLENIREFSLQAGRRFLTGGTHSVGVYGGAGYWRWQRNIAAVGSVSGLDETYRWNYYYIGGNVALLENTPHMLMADLRWRRMTRGKLNVDFRGVFDHADNLDLKVKDGWRVAVPWLYSLTRTDSLRVEPYWQGWGVQRSAAKPLLRNGVVVGEFFEPTSDTRLFGISAVWIHEY